MLKKLFGAKPSFKHKVGIFCIVKDEDPYLPEWIEYHLKIGVTQFYIYDHGSRVPITTLLKKYIDMGVVTPQTIEGVGIQTKAHALCLEKFGSQCQWMAFIDADEFLVPKTITGNLPDFLKDYEDYGGLGVNWLLFGSNGHIDKQTGQIHNYNKRTLKSNPVNGHIKSIIQPRFVKSPGADPHHFYFIKGKFCVNENFEVTRGPIVKHVSNKIQLNHYNLRSLEEYREKMKRGRADVDIERKLEYFFDLDKEANLVADESIIELEMLISQNKAG